MGQGGRILSGGVVVYVAQSVAAQVTLVSKSEVAERVWCMLHTERGPFLLGAWYRPLASETASISSCVAEHAGLCDGAMGTLLFG